MYINIFALLPFYIINYFLQFHLLYNKLECILNVTWLGKRRDKTFDDMGNGIQGRDFTFTVTWYHNQWPTDHNLKQNQLDRVRSTDTRSTVWTVSLAHWRVTSHAAAMKLNDDTCILWSSKESKTFQKRIFKNTFCCLL